MIFKVSISNLIYLSDLDLLVEIKIKCPENLTGSIMDVLKGLND